MGDRTGQFAAYAIPFNLYLNVFMAAALALTAYYTHPIIPIVSLFVVFALTYVFRQLGWTRAPFNDLKNKKRPKYGEFFKRYCNAFKEVFSGIDFRPNRALPVAERFPCLPTRLRPASRGSRGIDESR